MKAKVHFINRLENPFSFWKNFKKEMKLGEMQQTKLKQQRNTRIGKKSDNLVPSFETL